MRKSGRFFGPKLVRKVVTPSDTTGDTLGPRKRRMILVLSERSPIAIHPPTLFVMKAKRSSVRPLINFSTNTSVYGPTGLLLRSTPHSSRGAASFISFRFGTFAPSGTMMVSSSLRPINFCTTLLRPSTTSSLSGPISSPSRVTKRPSDELEQSRAAEGTGLAADHFRPEGVQPVDSD